MGCRAMKKVRNEMGFTNVEIMVPFVRTVGEAEQVSNLLAENGLKRGENDLKLIMMCELPANALLENAIRACKKANKYIGICGQGPSDHPDFAKWLMEHGIDSVSLNPDSVLDTWFFLADK